MRAAGLVASAPGVVLAGLWTHLQAAEDAISKAAQVARFEAASSAVTAAGIELPPRHLAASAGLMGDGGHAYDGVRPGLAIYGLIPDELDPASVPAGVADGLRPVMSLIARPVRVIDLPAGWGISYGPTFRTARRAASRPSRSATATAGRGGSRTGRAPSSAAGGSRSSATSRWTP